MEKFIKKVLEKFNIPFNKNNNKKMIENLIFVGVLGIVILIASNTIFKTTKIETLTYENEQDDILDENIEKNNKEFGLESKVEKILSHIKGVGKVEVLLTYESSMEKIYAFDTRTNESLEAVGNIDDENYNRSVNNEKAIVFNELSNERIPVVIKEIYPKVKGAIIVAEGANDYQLKENIIRATSVILDISVHKVEVFERSPYTK